jgi:hypothetical protein
MSIAVSALVKPSRAFRFVLGGAGLVQLGAACAAGLDGLFAPARGVAVSFAVPLPAALVTAALLLAGTLLLAAAARRPMTHRIDISGTGELRVTVQQGVPLPAWRDAQAVELLPGSAVWPLLMLLRYRAPRDGGTGRTHTLHVWRDSVDADAWRALRVALAVAGRRMDERTTCEKNR